MENYLPERKNISIKKKGKLNKLMFKGKSWKSQNKGNLRKERKIHINNSNDNEHNIKEEIKIMDFYMAQEIDGKKLGNN